MTAWFPDWIEGRSTPDEAESFAALRERAVAAINRALTRPEAVLVVAHGSFFRALRSAMGLDPKVRWPNAAPDLLHAAGTNGGAWAMEIVQRSNLRIPLRASLCETSFTNDSAFLASSCAR